MQIFSSQTTGEAHGQPVAAPRAAGHHTFVFLWKKAYISIDANHISNPKDR